MSTCRIQLAKPSFDDQELDAVKRVLDSGWVVQGPEVEAFEDAIATLHKVKHCIAVTSGTAALHLSYLALNIDAGDVVFIPSFAWPSAANMALQVGARPVLVDVLSGSYNIDSVDLQHRIDECLILGWGKPRVIVPVHQFGLAADLKSVASVAGKHGLVVLEDAACALGTNFQQRPVGNVGMLGVLSFHPRKAITTGEGGAVITNNAELAVRIHSWRNHGQIITNDGNRDISFPGLNYRMTEIQAAIGRVQLSKLPRILDKRKALAKRYISLLAEIDGLYLPVDYPEHTWQTFMVVLDDGIDRKTVIANMASRGIETGPGSISAHCMNVYQGMFGYHDRDFPVSLNLHHRGLALPLHECMSEEDVEEVVAELSETLKTMMAAVR